MKKFYEKIWDFFVENFNAMPKWLRYSCIIAVIAGVVYFCVIRPCVVYSEENRKTEEMCIQIENINKKIIKIEEIRIANEDMLYNIEEVRGIAQALSELHHDHIDLVLKHIKKYMTPEDYHQLMDEMFEADKLYKQSVNEMFEKKSKDHLQNNKTNEKGDE